MTLAQTRRVRRAILSLLLLLIAGGIAYLGYRLDHGQALGLEALIIGLIAVVLIPVPRQPQVLAFEPQSWTQQLLKWMSAPQIEALILLWFGVSLIAQPQFSSAFALSDSYLLTAILGWVFILLAWRMAVQLPSTFAYTVMTSYRLFYTLIVAVNVVITDGPLIILGAYVGGVLHGIVSMAVQWELRQIAQQMVDLREQIQQLQTEA